MVNLKALYKEFKNSKNRVYFFIEKQQYIFVVFIGITIILGLIGFSKEVKGLEVLNYTLALFFVEWGEGGNNIIYVAKLFAIITILIGASNFYLSQKLNEFKAKHIQKKPYTLVIGLGEHNSSFLKSLQKDKQVLIIDPDKQNQNSDYFKRKDFCIIESKTQDILTEIDLKQFKDCVISTGDDRQNIAIAMLIDQECTSKRTKRIYVRIENHDLSILFHQNIIRSNSNLDIIVYSLYENMAKELFSKHSILGFQPEIIKTNKAYNIVLIGDSPLAEEIVYHLSILSHLPEENILNLYLLGKKAERFFENIKKLFLGIEKIPHLTIKTVNKDYNTLSFFQDEIWYMDNLTNIIIAAQSEEKNLEIAINLQDTTYLRVEELKTKIHFAIYYDKGISSKIESDQESFANFYPFGNISKVSSKDELMDEKSDMIAKLIHANYLSKDLDIDLDVAIEELNKIWVGEKSTHFKRISNKAQALHIDTKLLSLGLKKLVSLKDKKELLKINEEKFKKFFPTKAREIYKDDYFPKSFETHLDKLARSEHNRWNAFHFLDGWEFSKERDYRKKRHPCLQPHEEFNTKALQSTYKLDIHAVLNIPKYLAYAGYELIEDVIKIDLESK